MGVIYTNEEVAALIMKHERRLKTLEANSSAIVVQEAIQAGGGTCSGAPSGSWSDCSDAPNVPQVTGVNVTTGKMLVFIISSIVSPANDFAYVSVKLTGATTLLPSILYALTVGSVPAIGLFACLAVPFEGIPNGAYTVTAKYATASGGVASYAARELVVITGH